MVNEEPDDDDDDYIENWRKEKSIFEESEGDSKGVTSGESVVGRKVETGGGGGAF
jgi:hypothetical protein